LRYLSQRSIKRTSGRRWKNHIIERSTRHDRLDRATPVETEETRK
jgi:hypothetical protein